MPKSRATCRTCGETYEVNPSQIRWRGSRYCSMACRRVGQKPKARKCAWCGEMFQPPNPGTVGRGKFCSRPCLYAHQKAERSRQVDLVCGACGVTFQRVAAWTKRNSGAIYCSAECKGRAQRRPGSTSYRGPGWRRLAETIRVRDGRRCVRCGAAEEVRQRLHVDHVVPWVLLAEHPHLANDPANLASLCGSCHGVKTHRIEPRLLRGDFLALQEFYGREMMLAAMTRLREAGTQPGLTEEPVPS